MLEDEEVASCSAIAKSSVFLPELLEYHQKHPKACDSLVRAACDRCSTSTNLQAHAAGTVQPPESAAKMLGPWPSLICTVAVTTLLLWVDTACRWHVP